ncbi:MAG TPA: T9SS type A sorting domain-containing protein, partial [Tenuifilaceae bacterium]|nr:T9SS type A sorting domain-containing protein [Tenuifilaceae bacterium]
IVTGTPITITAVQPATGYRLKEGFPRAYKTDSPETPIALTGNTDGSLSFSMAPYAVTVTVEFELIPNTVSVTADIPHGALAATPCENVTMGTEVTLTVTPTTGYQLVENSLRAYKTGDESVVVEIADGKFTMPAFDVTVTAEFEALPQTLTVATVANGTITATPSEGIVTDTEISLTTNPSAGYKLVENSLRAYKTGDESVAVAIVDGKFTMPAYDVTVTAEFEALPQTLTVATVANGTITATPSEGIVTGAEISLTTNPSAGYKLVENSLRAYKTGDESVVVSIVDGKFTMPAYDVTVTAQFEALPQTLTVTTVANGTITATPSEAIVTDTEITLSTTPAAGYKLTENSLRAYKTGDESVAVSIVDGKFTMPAFDVIVTAEFEALPQTLTVATVANGTITATPSEGIVTDTEITLSTTPAAGYKVTENSLRAYKTGDESVAVSIVDGKFTMPAYDVTVTAEFELIPAATYSVTVASGITNGTLTVEPNTSVAAGAEVMLTATPSAGYRLKEGSLKAHKTGDESVTLTITNSKFAMPAYDVTVTCQFELITGIDDNTTAAVNAYPNPFTDYVVIESEEQIRSVSFINLLGKTVQHTSMPETRISTQNLLPGIYLVKVDFAKGKPVVIRMVKQ